MDQSPELQKLDVRKLEGLTCDTFQSHIGSVFQARLDDRSAIRLKLVEAVDVKASPGAPRQDPFSLLFSGAKEVRLDQRTYDLEHSVLGTIPLFLTPVQPSDDSNFYESVFN